MPLKMQLRGYCRAPWWLWMVQMAYLDIVLPYMTSHLQLTIINLRTSCLLIGSPNRWWILQMYSKMQWMGWLLRMVQKLYLEVVLPWYDIPFSVDNCQLACLPPKDVGSIKCLQRCSWRAVPGAMTALNGSNDRPWHCLNMTSHFQLTITNLRASCLESTPKRWGILEMSSKM